MPASNSQWTPKNIALAVGSGVVIILVGVWLLYSMGYLGGGSAKPEDPLKSLTEDEKKQVQKSVQETQEQVKKKKPSGS